MFFVSSVHQDSARTLNTEHEINILETLEGVWCIFLYLSKGEKSRFFLNFLDRYPQNAGKRDELSQLIQLDAIGSYPGIQCHSHRLFPEHGEEQFRVLEGMAAQMMADYQFSKGSFALLTL